MNRTEIINNIISKYNFQSYLEIGVRNRGENFDLIKAKHKDGVDPAPVSPVNFKMTSNEFFKNHAKNKKYDIIFVDGLHTEEQVYFDVINSIKHLNNEGFIVMHDCNPPTKHHIRSYDEYLKNRGEWNGTVFRGFIKLKNDLKNWNCFVVDKDFGCGIITQRKLGKNFIPHKLMGIDVDWNFFEKNRKILLDLVSYDDFLEIINV